jgi:multidrug transporter EmrE-like cation transporter
MNISPWFLIFLAALNSTIGNILISKSQKDTLLMLNFLNPGFIIGCLCFALNLAFFAYALKFIDVSKAYPVLSGISFITLAIFGNIFLKEELSYLNLSGLIILVIGIYLLMK